MHRLTPLQTVIIAIALDVAVLTAVTILGGLRVIPGEAVIGLLGTILGARAMSRMGGGGPGSGSSSGQSLPPPRPSGEPPPGTRLQLAQVSTVAALALLLVGAFIHHHAREV